MIDSPWADEWDATPEAIRRDALRLDVAAPEGIDDLEPETLRILLMKERMDREYERLAIADETAAGVSFHGDSVLLAEAVAGSSGRRPRRRPTHALATVLMFKTELGIPEDESLLDGVRRLLTARSA